MGFVWNRDVGREVGLNIFIRKNSTYIHTILTIRDVFQKEAKGLYESVSQYNIHYNQPVTFTKK